MIRAIADAGPALTPLLRARQITAPSRYLDDVLAAQTTPRSDEALDNPATAASQQAQRLTRREREVLALLAQHLTDREIAERLVISPLTVRTHIEHLAEKLGVSGRRAIVARAAALNILT
ncbi:MAG: helix-turn-helix transcriptional regulator [Anaerolineales bacterium]|nr:helix-turn-helix transcriptional regulator [Anaerolineales bacterium]